MNRGNQNCSHKKCSKCKKTKRIDLFCKDRHKPDGHHPVCKKCHRKNYLENLEQRLEARKKYVSENRQKVNLSKKNYYYRNHSKIRKQAAQHYKRFRLNILKKNGEWRKNSIKGQLMTCRHGALKRGLQFSLSLKFFSSCIGAQCFYCGFLLKRCSFDRLKNSIGYVESNCVPCCWDCNRMKHAMSIENFLKHCKRIVNNNSSFYENKINQLEYIPSGGRGGERGWLNS